MNKQIYLGGTPLIDLSGYATESYVDSAVANVDVTEQLGNYVQKTALDASYGALDASIKSADASIAAIKETLADIVSDGSTDSVINTWSEMKAFVADYSTSNDLSTLVNNLKTQAVSDASADAASKYQPIGSYLVASDIANFVDAGDVATAINSSIAALDLANTYQAKGSYLTTTDAASTYQTINDASNHVAGTGVTSIVTISAADYALLETKSATTLYIVSD